MGAFKHAITKSSEETIGRRRGSRREKWIQTQTWDLIGERKKVKNRKQQARTDAEKEEAAY